MNPPAAIRSIAAALAAALALRAAPVRADFSFDAPRWFPSAGLSMPSLHGGRGDPIASPLVAASLPAAGAGGHPTVVDRYDPVDLWAASAVVGRWTDRSSNVLWVARFRTRLPEFRNWISYEDWESWRTRDDSAFGGDRDSVGSLTEAVISACPVAISSGPRRLRPANPAISRLLQYFSAESPGALVYVFLPKRSDWSDRQEWRMVAFVPAGDSPDSIPDPAAEKRFGAEFLSRISIPGRGRRTPPPLPGDDTLPPDGRARRKAVHEAFADYPQWTVSDTAEVTVADCLPDAVGRAFVSSLTNGLPRIRRAYADVLQGRIPAPSRDELSSLPPPLPVTNSLALVRVFAGNADYHAYLDNSSGPGHEGSAAVWMPSRRELVMNLQDATADDGLDAIVRHEAFHQCLFYAAAGAAAPPWFNEGLAELFSSARLAPGGVEFVFNERYAAIARALAPAMPELFPQLVSADYPQFYAGSPRECSIRYALAWSICWFLVSEDGAPALNGRPFRNVIPGCFAALRDTRSSAAATRAAFGDADGMSDFVQAWRLYWQER